jgi:hypothetical protein
MAGIPVGNALTGFAVEGLGVTVTIMAMAVVYLAVTPSACFSGRRCDRWIFQHPDDRTDSKLLRRRRPEFCTVVRQLSACLSSGSSDEQPSALSLIERLDQRVTGKRVGACRLSKALPQI